MLETGWGKNGFRKRDGARQVFGNRMGVWMGVWKKGEDVILDKIRSSLIWGTAWMHAHTLLESLDFWSPRPWVWGFEMGVSVLIFH